MKKRTEVLIMKEAIIRLYNHLGNMQYGSTWKTEYTDCKVLQDGRILLTGLFDNYYIVQDCWNGHNREWSNWTGDINNPNTPIGEQNQVS